MIRTQLGTFVAGTIVFALAASASGLDLVKSGGLLYEGTVVSNNDDGVVLDQENGPRTFRKGTVQEVIPGQGIEEYIKQQVDALTPEDATGRADLGILANRSGKKDVAEALFRKALEIDPANARAGRALHWQLVDGKYAPRPAATPAAGGGDADPAAADANVPLVGYTVEELIDGVNYEDFLLRNPNPKYTATVGSLCAGSLFGHEHKWKVVDLENNKKWKPTFKAKFTLKGTKTKTTTYQTFDVQTFYAATVTLELTRVADGVKVLYCTSEVERGHRDRSTAARNAFLDACNGIVESPEVKKAALWTDPAAAPEMKSPIKIAKKGS